MKMARTIAKIYNGLLTGSEDLQYLLFEKNIHMHLSWILNWSNLIQSNSVMLK